MPRAPKVSVPDRNLPSDLSSLRREERLDTVFPIRLLHPVPDEIDEMIPGVLLDLSASGIQVLTDQRFSLLLPPPLHSRLEVEFFLDELEIRQVPIQIARVKKLKNYQLMLGCKFIDLPAAARLAVRAEVAKRLSKPRN